VHGARALKVDRKTGDRTTIYVPNAAVSITGTIQPETLRRELCPEYFDNGLAARLLLAMPPTRPKRWTEAEVEPELLDAVGRSFEALYALRPAPEIDGYDTAVLVDLDTGAKAAWILFYNEHNEQLDGRAGAARAAFAKLEGYAARLALISHSCRAATGEKTSDYVDVVDVEAGVTLSRWFGQETERVYGVLSESSEERKLRELRHWIAEQGGRVSLRDLQRGPVRYRNDAVQAEVDLNELADAGLGSWAPVHTGARGGRPTHVFCLADSPDFPIARRDSDATRASA
jgi:hypothetical protein